MGERLRSVTIVGGGTAGWLTALLLATYARSSKSAPQDLKITLIESPSVKSVGVGEATVPSMPILLRQTGVNERDFFKRCNASFKLGVLFDNWNVDRNGKPIAFINSFNEGRMIRGVESAYYYLKYGAGGGPFSDVVTTALDLAREFKGPHPLGAKTEDQNPGFAYHLDAGLFADLLRDICVARGIDHVHDDVVDVEKDERGFIAALQLKERGRLPVELVVDCTGFRGMLINKALDEPFVDYSKCLANDRAAAIQIPHPNPDKLEPLTRSTALSSGWVWRVPLYNRVGTGYVFSSAHRSDDEACDELLAHLHATGQPPAKGSEPRIIPIRVGRTRNAWVKNCIAIGLSSGFIEPLESTAIFMIEKSVRWLLAYFPDSDFAEPLRARYNKVSNRLYDEVRDFICLHYALNNRADSPYWIDAREALEVPDSLAENLELWKHSLPTRHDLDSRLLFGHRIYHAVLLGKQVYGTGFAPPPVSAATLYPDTWRDYVKQFRRGVAQATQVLPDLKTLLATLRGELDPATLPGAAGPKIPAAPGLRGTVPLPGQAAPLKPQITMKRKGA
ncbi:tryptophan halogenase family protein [Pelagibius marinus]|uniref:tryptophan halogenase family protein n=1 Tax=Pelagibius marinus TaxID=2762760 RepID=UPI001872DACF|nr:tryptophan halogenase family protein [Pelagibius marinus]